MPESLITLIIGRKRSGKTTQAIIQVNNAEQSKQLIITKQDDRRLGHVQRDITGLNVNDTVVLIDDIRLTMNPNETLSVEFRDFLHTLHQRGNSVIITARRLVDIHTDIRSNADYIYCFHLTADVDLQALRNYTDATTIEKIRNLRDFEYAKICL